MSARGSPLQKSMSFTRMEPPPPEPRAPSDSSNTSQPANGDTDLSILQTAISPQSEEESQDDVFSPARDDNEVLSPSAGQLNPPQSFDELPIEIKSLTERFLESLSAKVHPSPLTIDALSDLFQQFYHRAESHIETHVATLSSRISRDKPSPNQSSAQRKESLKDRNAEQQMLTAEEIHGRKRARRHLARKRVALEEAVERAVCEKVYDKIWRHRSTDDEEKDQKLRSRIAALSLVGIGLKELLVSGAENVPDEIQRKTVEHENSIRESLSGARESIEAMTLERYPLAKLNHLTNAHKSIVETLQKLFPSSSSADEILPTLIYTLITLPPQNVNVTSDLLFIQRFRSSNKLEGEPSYCLVNLEAAISFLETVDLPSLRADEVPEGPDRAGNPPATPRSFNSNTIPMQLGITPATDPSAPQPEAFPPLAPSSTDLNIKPPPSPAPSRSPRRLSNLFQKQTHRMESASDTLRDAVLDSADQALDTLETSLRFIFGRIRDQHPHVTVKSDGAATPAPKTLEDARKLVSTPPSLAQDGDGASPPGLATPDDAASLHDDTASLQSASTTTREMRSSNRVLELVGGRRLDRERSVDSTMSRGSSTSNKRVLFADGSSPMPGGGSNALDSVTSTAPPLSSPLAAQGNAAVESMRNLGNSLNPLNQFAKMGGLFGRSSSSPNANAVVATAGSPREAGRSITTGELRTLAAVDELKKTNPPVKRFLECKDARDLRIADVEDLLAEFKRLAVGLGKVVGS